ncbi:acyl- :glycerol-3-phosphate acyltransferase [Schistosoma japonicum]|uniref:Acyl-:glycerol-3-phosphate acyltransferase n=1 Tax=Schistosoma japonicum TaxID=6182 RepID=A0A4Z2CVS4_SCHJA|nr:acyl- :glycerol-3-phosphate acyltransferase [Schistosoma japonicum]
MRFSSPKCQILLQKWSTSSPRLVIGSEVVEYIDHHFIHLGSLITHDGSVTDEMSPQILNARLTFINLRHLWRGRDIRLSTKDQVYSTSVHCVSMYVCKTWTMKIEDMRRSQVIDHTNLCSIIHI